MPSCAWRLPSPASLPAETWTWGRVRRPLGGSLPAEGGGLAEIPERGDVAAWKDRGRTPLGLRENRPAHHLMVCWVRERSGGECKESTAPAPLNRAIKSTLDHAERGLGVCGLGTRKVLTSLTSISRSLPSPPRSTHTAFPSTVIPLKTLLPFWKWGKGC